MSASPLSYLYSEDLYTLPSPTVVVTNKPWEKFTEEEKSLLSKILSSVKVGLSGVRVIFRPAATVEELVSLGSPRVLIFGSNVQVESYKLVQAHGFSIIRADELTALDDAKKKSLWLALKSMFDL